MLPTGSIATLRGNRLVILNSATGSAKLDLVSSIDFLEARSAYVFLPKMKAASVELLEGLEGFCESMNKCLVLAREPEKLLGNFDNLLKVMDSLLQVKNRKVEIDLMIDQLSLCYSTLAKDKVSVSKMDKRLEEVRSRWDEIKKAQPQVKTDMEPIQLSESERIKKDIEKFSAKVGL